MKNIKSFEDIKTIKSSELDDSCVVKDIMDKKKYTGTKKLNPEIGNKMIKVFNNYGFFVMGIGSGDYLNKQKIIFELEKKLKEYRVKLGLKNTWENFLESNGYDQQDFEELNLKEQQNLKSEFDNEGDISKEDLEFSVFLPNGVKNENNAFADAFEYLKLVEKSIPKMYENPTLPYPNEGGVLSDFPNDFKKFINNKNIKITNDNIEEVNTINYRLYKDSKFFYNLKEVCNNHNINYKELINSLLNIK